MKSGTAFVATLFALVSFPLLAQQPPPGNPTSPANQQSSPGTEQTPQYSQAPSSKTSTAEMSPVNGELVSKLDSKTAKSGDNVEVRTKTAVKTADGTEIPKGSKLVGHVIGVQPSESGNTSQVALLFDRIELNGGQSVPVHSQIRSIAPSGGAASTSGSGAMSAPAASGSSNPNSNEANPQSGTAPQGANSEASAGNPPPGTVVAKTGLINIETTSVPGVLLANNAPGQQDPRMAKTSSILLGAKRDIQLDSGTQMVIGVSTSGGGTQ
jgi:hypothetical protein